MSIKELVAKIKSGEVKSYDVVKSYVDTINKKEDKIPVKFKLTLRVFLFMDRFSGKNIVVICLLLCYSEYRRTKACFLHAG